MTIIQLVFLALCCVNAQDFQESHEAGSFADENSELAQAAAGLPFDNTFFSSNVEKGEFRVMGDTAHLENPKHAIMFVTALKNRLSLRNTGDWFKMVIPWRSEGATECAAWKCLEQGQKCFCRDSCVRQRPCPNPKFFERGAVPDCASRDVTCQRGTGDFRWGFYDSDGYTLPSRNNWAPEADSDSRLRDLGRARFRDMKGWHVNLFPHVANSLDAISAHPNHGVYINIPRSGGDGGPFSAARQFWGGGFETKLGEWTTFEVTAERKTGNKIEIGFSMGGKRPIRGVVEYPASHMPHQINSIWMMYVNGRGYSRVSLKRAVFTTGNRRNKALLLETEQETAQPVIAENAQDASATEYSFEN